MEGDGEDDSNKNVGNRTKYAPLLYIESKSERMRLDEEELRNKLTVQDPQEPMDLEDDGQRTEVITKLISSTRW